MLQLIQKLDLTAFDLVNCNT